MYEIDLGFTKLRLVARKPVYGSFIKVRYKQGCRTKQVMQIAEIPDDETKAIKQSSQWFHLCTGFEVCVQTHVFTADTL